jgi:PAS domain S-box-containing protein
VAELRQFRATFEHAGGRPGADRRRRIELANERLCSILGYAREDLVGRTFRDVSHPADRDASAALRAQLYAGTIPEFTLRKRYLRKDGTTVWVQITAAVVRSANGGPLYEITAFEDISEAVRIEAELRQSEQRFRALIENSADGIVLLGADGHIRYGSPATARILGYADNETLGLDSKALVHPEDIGAFLRDMEELLRAPGRTIAGRARLRHKDGSYRLLEGTWSNLLHLPGVEALAVNFRDITEQDRSRQALAEAEARYRSLTDLSSDWYWEQDAELRFVATGGSQDARGGITAAQHHGLRRWELPGTEALSGNWDEHKATLRARLPFRDLMLRRTGNDDAVHYVSVSGEPIFGQDGGFLGYRGIAKDVTVSQEAVRALQENERRLSALFSNLPGMAYRCRNDANWTSEFVSEGARR